MSRTNDDGTRAVRDCTCPRVRHRHGTAAAYNADECGCRPCTDAIAAYSRRRDQLRRLGLWAQTWEKRPAIGTVRRIHALATVGWSCTMLGERLGYTGARLRHIVAVQDEITPIIADGIASLYEQLWATTPPTMTQGQKVAVAKTIAIARRAGHPAPWQWIGVDIDDAAAEPRPEIETGVVDEVAVARALTGEYPRPGLSMDERTEAIRLLHDQGLTDAQVGQILGMTNDAVLKVRHRKLRSAA